MVRTWRPFIHTAKPADPSFDDFLLLARTGDNYFTQIGKMSDAIIERRVNDATRDSTWLPKIKVAFEKLLPAHYEALTTQAQKKGYGYTGKAKTFGPRKHFHGCRALWDNRRMAAATRG